MHILIPGNCEGHLIWQRHSKCGYVKGLKMGRQFRTIQAGCKCYKCLYKRGRHIEITDRREEGNVPTEVESGGCCHKPRNTWRSQKIRTRSYPETPERAQPANTLVPAWYRPNTDFGLLASGTVQELISVVLSHQVCGRSLQQEATGCALPAWWNEAARCLVRLLAK